MLTRAHHVWRHIIARIRRSSRLHPDRFTDVTPALSRAEQTLSAELGTLHTDLEQTRAALENKLRRLDQQRGQIAAIQDRDRNRLRGLECRFDESDGARRQVQERISRLEAALANTGGRLDSTAQQLATLDDRATAQIRALGASLGQAVARSEESENHARSGLQQLASSLQETRTTQQRLHRRLDRSITVAGGVLLLGTVAGAVLVRDIQANTRMLAGLRGDMKVLLASIDQHPAPQQARPEPPAPVVPPPPAAARPAPPEPAAPAVSETRPAPPWAAPPVAGKRDANRYFLGRELNLFREAGLAGEPDAAARVVTTASGLQYQVIAAGSGRHPRPTDRVVLDYLAMTEDGTTLVDTYTAGTPATLDLAGDLIPGWREALLLMREGAEWGLYVPPHLAATGRVATDDATDVATGFYLLRLLEVITPGRPG